MKAYHKSMKTVVSERGQITLPKTIRTNLGLRPGTVVEIAIVDGKIVGWKKEDKDVFLSWRGRGQYPFEAGSVNEYIRAVRE